MWWAVAFIGLALLVVLLSPNVRKRLLGTWAGFWGWIDRTFPTIPRHRIVALISLATCVIVVIATAWWRWNYQESEAEPTSQLIIAIAWLFTAILELLIPADPEWEVIRAKRAKAETELLQAVLRCLREERLDFCQIRDRRGAYNSAAHRRAAEVQSFELLKPEIEKLHTVRGYRQSAKAILTEIERNQQTERKAVDELIRLLDQLEPRLQSHIEKLEGVFRGLA